MDAPYIPSSMEREFYYYGIYSRPPLVARSSYDRWIAPTGPEAYLASKEIKPAGLTALKGVWEKSLGRAMGEYLDSMGVQCSSLDPIRIGTVDEETPPLIIWVGVNPGSLTPEDGVKVAIQCKGMLDEYSFHDIHIEIRESQFTLAAKLYRPVVNSNPTAKAREAFSTSLGIPISSEATPDIGGTAAFFFSVANRKGKLFLLTARHVLFPPDSEPNELYIYRGSGDKKRNVLLLGHEGYKKRIELIESEIKDRVMMIEYLHRRMDAADRMGDKEDAEKERMEVRYELEKENNSKVVLEEFLLEVERNWGKIENRIIGHVVLSPPLKFNVGDRGSTQDWAVIEIHKSKVDETNFLGNCIDLDPSIDVTRFTKWMYPHPTNPHWFSYPENRLLSIFDKLSDKEMKRPDPKIIDQHKDPVIMVIKNGATSGVTAGRLNTIDSFIRFYYKGKPGEWSREVSVLGRDSKSGPFSYKGDSGSAVVAGDGKLAGLLTGGTGPPEALDCTYVTSIDAILEGLELFDYKANLYPIV